MNVLGIESSCDESAASVINLHRNVLSNVIHSQVDLHKIYGGVVPSIAARSHSQNLKWVIEKSIHDSGLDLQDIDAFAATSGPGLIGGLMVGIMYGKMLASITKKKFIAINHLEAHALSPKITENIKYPYLLLLVSGGHSQFIAVLDFRKYKVLGSTLDDSVGEAFDKVAKLLGFGYPGGALIEQNALHGDEKKYALPLSMTDKDSCDMSFSGLKTAVFYMTKKIDNVTDVFVKDMSASFQYTVSEILINKSRKAIRVFKDIVNKKTTGNSFVVAGGVASNEYLSSKLKIMSENEGFQFFKPKKEYCTDNAAMVAYCGLEALKYGIQNNLSFTPMSKWSIEDVRR